jgi:CRP-like cAMP-binding protein/FixJ family two-component response regulator
MKTILLIEDNQDVRENTAEILELSNYKVLTAENGKKGVVLATKERPDLIICDIMMPVLDGYGTLHLLGKNKDTANIPFIFLTAKTDRSDLRKGMEMGADDYLTKPFDDVELLKAIETRLKRTEALKRDYETSIEGVNEFLEQAKKIHNLKLISGDREVRTYPKRQTIYEEETRPMYLFFVNKGKVKIFRRNDEGKELITAIMKDGEFFGYTTLLEGKAYEDSAEALEESEIMMIPKSEFDELINHDPQVATQFIKMLANRLSGQEDELVRLAYNSVRKRVADALLLVYERYKNSEKDKPSLKITREDLAHIVGTATESLIRTLSDFRIEKLIDINDGKITIVNEEKLKKMLN